MNTSLGVTALYDVFKMQASDKTKLALIADFDRVLSLDLIAAANKVRKPAAEAAPEANVSDELRAYIEEQIEARRAAKAAKNYAEADRIRIALSEQGITLIDTKEGTRFTVAEK